MSLALFEEGSQLQKKIDYEKNLRRRSTITQTSLMAELSELLASPSGKPNTSVTNRSPKARVVSENIEASSSGRVSAALVRALSDAPAPGPVAQVARLKGNFEEVEFSYSDDDCDTAERFEEDDDPEAAFCEPEPEHVFTDPTTYKILNGDTNTQGIGEYSQQPPAFKFGNDTNLNIYDDIARSSAPTSFMDFLMDDEINFNFRFDSSFTVTDNSSNDAGGLPQQSPYRSAAASSSGEDLSTYADYALAGLGSETYSSLEGESGDSSVYGLGHWDSINVSSYYSEDTDTIDDRDNPDMILPMPRIPTSSPPGSSPVQPQIPLVDAEAYTILSLKRPHAPVAADLDTANILPFEHRRKRIKPARVTHMDTT